MIRDLVLNDPVAHERWALVVDRVLKPSDAIQVKKIMDIKFAEAVLQSLQIWNSYGREHADLIPVLRQYGLNGLAGEFS